MNTCKHYWIEHYVKTDAGEAVLTVCKFCTACKVDHEGKELKIREALSAEEFTGALECMTVFGKARMNKDSDSTQTFVARIGDKIVGAARLVLIERLVNGREARIEDVAVLKEYGKQGIGTHLVIHLRSHAIDVLGCYKVQLCCRPELERWYSSLGFRRHEINMRYDA